MLPPPAEKLQNFFGVFLQFQIGVDIWCAPQNILISLCVTAILCVGGYLLGVKMLGKHFKPAGVA